MIQCSINQKTIAHDRNLQSAIKINKLTNISQFCCKGQSFFGFQKTWGYCLADAKPRLSDLSDKFEPKLIESNLLPMCLLVGQLCSSASGGNARSRHRTPLVNSEPSRMSCKQGKEKIKIFVESGNRIKVRVWGPGGHKTTRSFRS